ncbi:MAG: hypothetical protein IJ254_09155 [Succinivibrio sp.]|nr:hypothetical protein [Succinivibrio sp.]
MKFKSLLLLLGAASLLLTGCVNATVQSKPVSVTKIEQNVTKNQTTLSDLRAMLGTPFVIGKTLDDHKKVAGFMLRNNTWGSVGKNFAKHMLTFGFGAKATPFLIKNAIFKFDDNDVVTDYSFNGYNFIIKHRIGTWNEADRELTDEELKSDVVYSIDETYDKYLESVAKEKGVAVSDLDSDIKGKEFPFCNIACHGVKGVNKAFGPFEITEGDPSSEPNDGSKSILVE